MFYSVQVHPGLYQTSLFTAPLVPALVLQSISVLHRTFWVLFYPVCRSHILSCGVGAESVSVAACRGKPRSQNAIPSCAAFGCCCSEKRQQTCLCEGMTKVQFNMHMNNVLSAMLDVCGEENTGVLSEASAF